MIMFPELVLSYFSIDIYEILIVQDSKGELITVKIDEYGRTETPDYVRNDQIIH